MNINFRKQPEPLLSPRGSTKPGPNEGNISLRHNPQPRNVCHIKALKDVPVCAVSDPGYMPGIEQGLRQMRTRTSVGHTFPDATTLNLQSLTSKRNSYPQPISYDMKENTALLTNKTWNRPILKRKSDLLRKYIPEQLQNMPAPDVHAISPTLALRYRPEIMENMNYTSSYLDNEIKILEKLCDILQTDSVAEIKDWLSKASLREKELVSNFIRSDISTRDLLNYHRKYVQSGSEAVHLNLQAILKGPKAIGSTEEKLLRNICQGSRANIGKRSDRERDNSLTRREKIRTPTSDPLPLEHSPSRSKVQERRPSPPSLPQSSGHLLYSRCRVRRAQLTPEENSPPKQL